MDFAWTPEQIELRERARKVATEAVERFGRSNDSWINGYSKEFAKEMAAHGWIGMTWPTEFGGGGRPPIERLIVGEEMIKAGAPIAAMWFADRQMGPSLITYGRPDQQAEFLPRILSGETTWCIGMSEPDAGSDLASIRTKAVRDGDGNWLVSGAKVWTSNAHTSHYGIVLVRTSPLDTVNRHAGMSQLLIDLSLPGITINPIRILDGGHHFNEVVFDDVVLPADMLLGEEGNGWHQVTAELAFERSGPERFLSTYPLVAEFARRVADSRDPAALATLGRLSARLLALRQLSLRIAAALDRGELPDIPAALVKDVGTTFEGDVIEEIRRVVDVAPSLDSPDPLGRALAEAQLHAPGYTLRGGTNEILRGIVARGLGLR